MEAVINNIKALKIGGQQRNGLPPKDIMNNVRACLFPNRNTSLLRNTGPTPCTTQRHQQDVTGTVLKDKRLLKTLFRYFSACDLCVLSQVCRTWRDLLYTQPANWTQLMPVVHFRDWQQDRSGKTELEQAEFRARFYHSLLVRGFDSWCIFGARDTDVLDLLAHCMPRAHTQVTALALRCSSVSDAGLQKLLSSLSNVVNLELSGCNDITEAGLCACLNVRMISLCISDCINVADDTVGAIAQLLPALEEFTLQAYHVTDTALAYFGGRQGDTLTTLRLTSCWEITNHGLVNVVHSLPNLTVLSVSGCSKITDDGVELIAENLRHLRSLDLSWCHRVTDAALEYIACDLPNLEELVLDRCLHVTDMGVGYISTMTLLSHLFLRWCSQIKDTGLQHIYGMSNLRVLSIAGCSQLSGGAMAGLVQLRHLEELELTNCPGATQQLCEYIRDNLPHDCLIIE